MKDPKVTELVKQFNKEIIALNKTWTLLHNNDVYVRLEIKGGSSYSEPKLLEASEIMQRVTYLTEAGE